MTGNENIIDDRLTCPHFLKITEGVRTEHLYMLHLLYIVKHNIGIGPDIPYELRQGQTIQTLHANKS